jgi:serine/threonine-protein kinase
MILGITIVLGIPLAAVGLSVRNVKLGRTDTRGAARLAAVAGGATLAAALLGSHFAADPAWLQTSFLLASWAAFAAVLSWVLYAALEPYVRRQWPQMLISSSRLLDGRWRDPLVGRDVLIGGVLALALGAVQELQASIRLWRGGPPPLSSPVAQWEGLHLTVADLVRAVPEAIWIALGLAMFLVLLRLLLRSKIAAAVGFVVIMQIPVALGNADPMVAVPFQLLMLSSWVVIATRFGLVMLATYLLVNQISFGGGFAAPGFAQSSVMFTMAAIVALGLFGFYTATRGRKASAWLDG